MFKEIGSRLDDFLRDLLDDKNFQKNDLQKNDLQKRARIIEDGLIPTSLSLPYGRGAYVWLKAFKGFQSGLDRIHRDIPAIHSWSQRIGHFQDIDTITIALCVRIVVVQEPEIYI